MFNKIKSFSEKIASKALVKFIKFRYKTLDFVKKALKFLMKLLNWLLQLLKLRKPQPSQAGAGQGSHSQGNSKGDNKPKKTSTGEVVSLADAEKEAKEKEKKDLMAKIRELLKKRGYAGVDNLSDEQVERVLKNNNGGSSHFAPTKQVKDFDIAEKNYHKSFYKKLCSILKDNAYSRSVGGYKSGKLDTRRVYKVGIKSDNTRVFRRRLERQGKNYNVAIVLDHSGSMYPTNLHMALKLSAILMRGLQHANVKVALIGYDNLGVVYKPFNTKPYNRVQMVELYKTVMADVLGGTGEHYGLEKAWEEFQKVPSGVNMTFVITDGGADDFDKARKWANKIETISQLYVVDLRGYTVNYHKKENIIMVHDEREFLDSVISKISKQVRRA